MPSQNPGSSGSDEIYSRRLFCGGLDSYCTKDHLFEYFSNYGHILETQVLYDRETMNSRGFGFVTFASASERDSTLHNGE